MRIAGKGLIDRTKPVTFTFDGKAYSGFQGDTLASALMANSVRLVGRSFKYHRPRGILTAGPEEPNAMVEVLDGGSQSPNTRATVQEIYDGMAAQSQNRWPSLRYDLLSINDLAAPFLSAVSTTRPSCGRAPSGRRFTSPSSAAPRVLGA